jgi:hypothetical protein
VNELVRQHSKVAINKEFVIQTLQCNPKNYPQMLEEKYPHVLERIIKLWNKSSGEDYLNDLLKPTYSGGRHQREGFPEKAWDEIFFLLTLYKRPRPKPALEEQDTSSDREYKLFGFLPNPFANSKAKR